MIGKVTVREITTMTNFNETPGYFDKPLDQRIGTLTVTAEKFSECAKLELPEEMVKNLKGLDYLNIAHAIFLLKQHYPTLSPMLVRNEYGEPFLDLPDERGTMLGVYFMDSSTGACTAIHWFPVMGNRKGAVKPAEIEPDARSLNDNIARAIVKAMAYFLGIGFNVYSRLELDDLEEAELGAKPVEKGTKTKFRTSKPEIVDDDEEDDEYDEDEDNDEDEDDDDDEDEEPTPPRKTSKYSSRKTRLPLRGGRK